jgi:hypothetical protein
MDTAAPTQPLDQGIIDAVRELYVEQPKLGRGKLWVYTTLHTKSTLIMYPKSRLVQLKAAQNWTLSDSRRKKVLAENDLKRKGEEPKSLPPIQLPADALAAQQRYKRDSTRISKLYG